MKKQLFFDDNELFVIDNLKREYGKYTIAAVYEDPSCSTDLCTGHVFKLDDGRYRMLYFAHSNLYKGMKLLSAISDNGIDFSPERLFENKQISNEILDVTGCEVAYIYDDERNKNTSERYKMLITRLNGGQLRVEDQLWVSANLIDWQKIDDVSWGNGTEPLAGVFYNDKKGVYTILERPFWGIRRVGYKETVDWRNFTEYRECLNVDALDERLSEIYGMFAFPYDGMFIGIPHIYRGLGNELNAKYSNGFIDTQLAYSHDGRYWRRSLREPFISGLERKEDRRLMTWVTDMKRLDDGNIYFYGSASACEHGTVFDSPSDSGEIIIYKMRQDGFMPLITEDKSRESCVATREKIWQGGDLHLNIKAKRATVAVYSSSIDIYVAGNAFGKSKLLPGFSHEDCIPFSGDSCDWVPAYKSGKSLDEYKGSTLVFEIKFECGELYSISGEFIDAFNTEGIRYRKLGVLPQSK